MNDSNQTGDFSAGAGNLDALSEAARDGAQRARQAGSEALNQAQGVAGEAQSRAASTLGHLGDQASAAADAQKGAVADRIEDVAKAVHKSGEQLEGQSDFMARLVEQGADELSSLAGALRNRDIKSLLGDLKGLAERQPALFVGASMAVGFALTRVGMIAASNSASSPTEDRPGPVRTSATAWDGESRGAPGDGSPSYLSIDPHTPPVGLEGVNHERF